MTRTSKKVLKSIIALILVAVISTAIFFTISHFKKDDGNSNPGTEQTTPNKNNTASASGSSTLEVRINILEDHIASTQSQLKALSENAEDNDIAIIQKMNELSKQLLEAQTALNFLTEEFDKSSITTEEYYKLNLARIQSIEDSLIEIRANMSELSTIKNKIQILEENIAALITRLDNMVGEPGEMEAIRQQLAVVQAEYNLLLSDVDSNTSQIEIIKNQMDILNSKVSSISNPNLLINGDFKINQRGQTTYSTANSYTVDRWKLVSGTLTVTETGIKLNGTITQILEKIPTEKCCPFVKTTGTEGIEYTYSNGVFTIIGYNVDILWAKLEVGSVSTAFSPKTQQQELADCQRYYIKLGGKSYWRPFGNVVISNSTDFDLYIPFPTTMRAMPTLTYSGLFRVLDGVMSSPPTVKSFSLSQYSSDINCALIVGKASGLTAGRGATVTACGQPSWMAFDAEIY